MLYYDSSVMLYCILHVYSEKPRAMPPDRRPSTAALPGWQGECNDIIIITIIIISFICVIMFITIPTFIYIIMVITIITTITIIIIIIIIISAYVSVRARCGSIRHRLNGYLAQRAPSLFLASSFSVWIMQFWNVRFPGGLGTH